MSNIIPYNELTQRATSVAKSGLFGLKSVDQAMTLLMIAEAEGSHPMKAIMDYDIISGKPALKSTAILSRFQDAGGFVEWIETNDKKAVAKFTHKQGGTITITWTIERAKQAGVYESNPTWKKYPDQMLRARCIPEGVRAIYPSCLNGSYSVEEVQCFNTPQIQQQEEFMQDAEFTDVEETQEEPKVNLTVEKSKLTKKMKDLGLTVKEIKEFAEMFNIIDDAEAVQELNENEELLLQKIKQYEELLNDNQN